MPVETMTGLDCLGSYTGCEVWEDMALSSGVLDMIADARLISEGFGGADIDFGGGETACASGGIKAFVRLISADWRWFAAAGAGFDAVGANASSANLSATLWDKSLCG